MERAGRVLSRIKRASLSAEELARTSWPAAVGKAIAAHSVVTGLVRERLIVEVGDSVWQRQLFTLRHQILAKIDRAIGPGLVTDIEFRVRVPRPAPQREESARCSEDEADRIEDPVLRRLYVASRKKASA